ncbi:MAG: restriction endonuclease subunit S [Microcystis aeruginosa BK11-02]|nr:restriction endonuclease subunit S [Microcystis aeruginosa BK11-02]
MVSSELGDIPEGWRVGKLGDEFEILMGQSPSGSTFNENKQGIIFFQGRTDFGFRFPTIRLYTTEPSRIAEKFDVLVSVRAPVGDVNLASEKCCIGRGLAAVKSQYKSYCLHKIKSFKKLFNVFESEGTVFGSINKQSFNSLESIIPINKVIKDFEAIITTIDQKFYVNDLQIQTLTKIRDSLLPKLMSGQIRVEE